MPAEGQEAPGARFAFAVAPELAARTEAVIDKLRASEDRKQHVAELVEVVLELTEAGLHFYYLHPLELAGVGLVSRSAAKVGIAAAGKGIPIIVRRVVGSMSDDQLLRIAEFIDRMLVREPPGREPAQTSS